MAVPVIMPRQGQSVETCIITQWIKKKGETVKKGDILFSYETDKASFDAESEADGILLEIFRQEGDEVPVLTSVAAIGNKGENVDALQPEAALHETVRPETEKTTPAETSNDVRSKTTGVYEQKRGAAKASADVPLQKAEAGDRQSDGTDTRIRISPRARAMASELGVESYAIRGTGPNGRIIVRDIESAPKETKASPKQLVYKEPAEIKDYTVAPGTGYEDKKLTNVRRLIARAMHESISMSAQLTHHMSADVRHLLALRDKVKAEMAQGSTINITLNDMVCFATIKALQKFPEVNSHFLGESIRTFRKVHLGIAVDTPRGLMVPVVQNASDLSLQGLSGRLAGVADQCRKGNINPELLASTAASFTVSNLGNYGVELFTPIINLPQVAILGVNTITYRPADLGKGVFGFIPVMGLSLTYDHRAIDGGPATLFLKEIKDQIEAFNEKI
ncbi:MAG: 2-oxo acid dehydrogenase subunit E2 [Bacteroidales bacterium]|nr:2-oxo acid dehydrogenase subunit E2 [Bacteroidales bacterium]